MKKIIAFSVPLDYAQQVATNNPVREFSENDVKGYEVDQVIFSTAFNRNKCYVQVAKFMAYKDKLSKLLSNLNHDLSLTDGQYVSSQKAGYTKIWEMWNNGDLEIWGTFRTTDERFIANRESINAPSVELIVDTTKGIISEDGEYYDDFEWVGTAQLVGVMAGSGDARNASEIRDFNLDLTPINNNMSEEQIQALLEEQKQEFSASLESLKKEFAVVAQAQCVEESVYEYMDEDGNKYRTTSTEVMQSVTELLENGVTENNSIVTMMKAKGFSVVANEETETEETEITEKSEENTEVTETLEQVNNALEQVNSATKAFNEVKGSESQLDPEQGAKGDVIRDFKMSDLIANLNPQLK